MATTFVKADTVEQEYDLWLAELLYYRFGDNGPHTRVRAKQSNHSRKHMLDAWRRAYKEDTMDTQYGYLVED